jgi:hypothetical protein
MAVRETREAMEMIPPKQDNNHPHPSQNTHLQDMKQLWMGKFNAQGDKSLAGMHRTLIDPIPRRKMRFFEHIMLSCRAETRKRDPSLKSIQ